MKNYKSIFKEEESDSEKSFKSIKELIDTSWGGNDKDRGKAISLLKGLVFSNSKNADLFLQKLDDFTSSLNENDFKP